MVSLYAHRTLAPPLYSIIPIIHSIITTIVTITLHTSSNLEEYQNSIDVGEAEPDGTPLCEKFKVPPAKVRSTKPAWGIGTFVRINSDSGNFLYEFQNGDWVEV